MIPSRKTIALAGLIVGGIAGCGAPPKKRPMTLQEMIAADPLPLAKGAKWTYTVRVKRFDADANQVTTRTIPWVTEVVDAREQNGVTAFRIKGWPTDLANYDGSAAPPVPSETTILRVDNQFLFGATAEPVLDGANGWFRWPVIDGDRICPSGAVYCWQVTAVETGYRFSQMSGPFEQSFELEPGTGVSRFHVTHHDTTNEVEAKLVAFSGAKR